MRKREKELKEISGLDELRLEVIPRAFGLRAMFCSLRKQEKKQESIQ